MPGEQDPVARAEEALAAISGDFSQWMHDECARLDAARRKVRELGLSRQTRQELFLAAHDVKGDSGTLGYPEVARPPTACAGCSSTPPISPRSRWRSSISMSMRSAPSCASTSAPDIAAIAAALTSKLRAVTDEFLVKENRHRPDVLKAIQSPALVPGESF